MPWEHDGSLEFTGFFYDPECVSALNEKQEVSTEIRNVHLFMHLDLAVSRTFYRHAAMVEDTAKPLMARALSKDEVKFGWDFVRAAFALSIVKAFSSIIWVVGCDRIGILYVN